MKPLLTARYVLNLTDEAIAELSIYQKKSIQKFINSQCDVLTNNINQMSPNPINQETVRVLKEEKTKLLVIRENLFK